MIHTGYVSLVGLHDATCVAAFLPPKLRRYADHARSPKVQNALSSTI